MKDIWFRRVGNYPVHWKGWVCVAVCLGAAIPSFIILSGSKIPLYRLMSFGWLILVFLCYFAVFFKKSE